MCRSRIEAVFMCYTVALIGPALKTEHLTIFVPRSLERVNALALRNMTNNFDLKDRWPLLARDEQPVVLSIVGNAVQHRFFV